MTKKTLLFFCMVYLFSTPLFAESTSDGDSRTNYDQAVSFLQREQYDSAIEFFQKALLDQPAPAAQSRIFNLTGLAYLKQGVSIPSAIGSFEQSIKLDPQFAEPYFNIASAYASDSENLEKAAEYFQKTIEVDPHFFKAYFGLGWFTLMQKDNPGKAIEYFQKTIEQYPEFAEAHYGIGMAYIRTHKPHMALGSVSQLRGLKRDDLAAVLEKAISEVAPPTEATSVVSAPKQASSAAVAESQPVVDAQPRKKGKSPFEMIRRGKITRANAA